MSDPEAPPAYVYVIASTGPRGLRTYVGWSPDPQRRLQDHNSGTTRGARSTRGAQWQIIYLERCADRRAAMSREWYLKRDRAFRRRLREGLSPGLAAAESCG